ncbi:MAG: bifunctional DNA-formamidopyrimidine glycosylase/DNA-(apurinic or apyrimidinic site) lyase [Hyphomicrobium sp.]|nr:bifunctional DNA-formamidopyrimidine glycosylase/DNA-(apurinic or apyrimidinic site) lyase [Hyphomicrobium sp.]
MPELPEVETIRRGLEPVLVGQRIARVEQRRADLRFPFPENFGKRLTGRTVVTLQRRAKYLLAHLDDGTVLIIHLGMSGRISITGQGQLGEFTHNQGNRNIHDHVVLRLGSGTEIVYNDPRRFGLMDLASATTLDTHPLLAGIGIEPLGPGLTPEYLARHAAGRRSDLKSFLLDQRIIAGLGNIYVCEALFRTHLKPSRAAACLATPTGKPNARTSALIPHIRAVLADAIEAGGSTLRDYAQADGSLGYFQHSFQVYGREGEPCLTPACRGMVHRTVQGGRSTFFCPVCQR